MAIQPKLRRGVEANRSTQSLYETQLLYTTDKKELWIGDGTTNGGEKVSSVLKGDETRRNVDANTLAGQTRFDAVGSGSNMPGTYGTLTTHANLDVTTQTYIPYTASNINQMWFRSQAGNLINGTWSKVVTDLALPLTGEGFHAHTDGNDYVNVVNHISDLTGSSDMAAELQALVNRVNNGDFNSKTIFIPAQVKMRVSVRILVYQGITILGEQVAAAYSGEVSTVIADGYGFQMYSGSTIKGLTIRRTSIDINNPQNYGIYTNNNTEITQVTVRDCVIYGFQVGLNFNRGVRVHDTNISDMTIDCQDGVTLQAGDRCHLSNIKLFPLQGSKAVGGSGVQRGMGIYVNNTINPEAYSSILIENITCEGWYVAVKMSHMDLFTIRSVSNLCEATNGNHIEVEGDTHGIITDCTFIGGEHGIVAIAHSGGVLQVYNSSFDTMTYEGILSAENLVVSGCRFSHCNTCIAGNGSSLAFQVTGCMFHVSTNGMIYSGTTPSLSKSTGNIFLTVSTHHTGSITIV